jgi:hypothetical protein
MSSRTRKMKWANWDKTIPHRFSGPALHRVMTKAQKKMRFQAPLLTKPQLAEVLTSFRGFSDER